MFIELSGIPNLITADMIKEGAAVIDVGINRVQDPATGKSRLVGDVDFEGKAGTINVMYFRVDMLGFSDVCNGALFLPIFRRETEGGLHHPRTWRCGTHDCGDADEEHYQSGQERSAVPPGEDPHGGCVLMRHEENPSNSDTFQSLQRQHHHPPHFLLGAT